MEDVITFEVFGPRLSKFKAFIKEADGFSIACTKKDGGYVKVTVNNKYQIEGWSPVTRFYRDSIKI